MLVTKSNPVVDGWGRHQGEDIQGRGHRTEPEKGRKKTEEGDMGREHETKGQREESEPERQRDRDKRVGAWREREDKREERGLESSGPQRVPTQVAVGRDWDAAGVLLLLAPRLVGPVVQVRQVCWALLTELHPGSACKDRLVSSRGGSTKA